MNLVFNGLMFNLSWYLIVSSQDAAVAWAIALSHVLLHQLLLGKGRRELLLILAAGCYGLLLDQVLFFAGVLTAPGGNAPLWLSALWPVFACTLLHAFAGLRRRPLLASVVGAVGGYGSYRLGAALSAVEFGGPGAGIAIGLLWAGIFPLALIAAESFVNSDQGGMAGAEGLS